MNGNFQPRQADLSATGTEIDAAESYLEKHPVTTPLTSIVSAHCNIFLPLLWRQLLIERTHNPESCISPALSCCFTFGLFLNVPHF